MLYSKLAYYFHDRYLSEEDNVFLELVKADLEDFLTRQTKKVVLLFPPVNNYLRLLIHKIVENYSELHSFSVGEGLSRQTVVCWSKDLLGGQGPAAVPTPSSINMRGRARPRVRDSQKPGQRNDNINEFASSDKINKCIQKSPAVTHQQEKVPICLEHQDQGKVNTVSASNETVAYQTPDRTQKLERSKNRRPDVQVYVPRGRRHQQTNSSSTATSHVTSQRLLVMDNSFGSIQECVPQMKTLDRTSEDQQFIKQNRAEILPSSDRSLNMKEKSKLSEKGDTSDSGDIEETDILNCEFETDKSIFHTALLQTVSCQAEMMAVSAETTTFAECGDKDGSSSRNVIEGMLHIQTENSLKQESQCAQSVESLDQFNQLDYEPDEDFQSVNTGIYGKKQLRKSDGLLENDGSCDSSDCRQYQSQCTVKSDERSDTFLDIPMQSVSVFNSSDEQLVMVKGVDEATCLSNDKKICEACSDESTLKLDDTEVSNLETISGYKKVYSQENEKELWSGEVIKVVNIPSTIGLNTDMADCKDRISCSSIDMEVKLGGVCTSSEDLCVDDEVNCDAGETKVSNEVINVNIQGNQNTNISSVGNLPTNELLHCMDMNKNQSAFKDNTAVESGIVLPSDNQSVAVESGIVLPSDNQSVADENYSRSATEPAHFEHDQHSDRDEDSWDAMFDDDGECLDPAAMEKLTETVGNVKIRKSKKIDYLQYQLKEHAEMNYTQYEHIIEIYDFPAEFVTRDLITAFQQFMSRGFDLKWVDDTHALGIFSSPIAANDALNMVHPLLKVSPLSQASKQSQSKARRCTEFLQPYKPRPETTAAAARRLVAGALGIATNVSTEKRERERKQLMDAKAKRRQERKNQEDIWEYGKCAMDKDCG